MSLFGKPSEKPEGRQREGESREPAPGGGPAERAAAAPRAEAGAAAAPRGGAFSGDDFKRGGKEVANIGKSISIKGDLTGNEDIVIEGKVEGKVELPNNQLTIGANGQVKAEINAKGVIVVGRVAGNIRGTDRVEIQATGVVEGDVSAPRLVVAEGAVVNGSIQMGKEAVAAAAAAAAARPASEPVRKVG
jgi:cytoskeletal protein CcmA (bactofilin family)